MKLPADDRRSQIVEEATRLFSADGYEKATTKRLAAACGVTEPALYRYFPSKEDIYEAVLDSLRERLDCQELFEHLEKEDDIEAILFELANHIFIFTQKNQDIYRLLLFSALGGHTKAKQVYQAIRGRHVHFLHRQLNRLSLGGTIRQNNTEITARCFIGMIFDCALGATLWRGKQGKIYKPDDVVANNVPIFAGGLKTVPSSSQPVSQRQTSQ